MSEDSVKVAVRVRPFNAREQERQAKLIIDMQSAMTLISNPDAPGEEPKKFTFDFSYWSHDGYQEDESGLLVPASTGKSRYASQQMVFEDLGQGVLHNAFEGYNCSLFAYGQTGSGKSYSMVGYGKNRGIVPITCDKLFERMSATNKDRGMRYEVTFSMLEIYNEQVRDLLSKENPKGGLQVHQNPKLGVFYVEGLKHIPVGSYDEIEKRMEQGTANRTVASTNMNATSSRAHTVVSITFDQISKDESTGDEKKRSSVMNLVDLAGSERADSTGATGDRLKEGANINKSLSALGNVISALADLSSGTKRKIVVPYRDSVLTKLLQNALGGNSKTVMIAALSPADINYEETLSTLRYADRAKKIRNKAVINENAVDKMIRELKEENEKLKKAMQGGLIQTTAGMSPEEITQMRKRMEEEIRAQLEVNAAKMVDTERSWEDKLKEARKESIGEGQGDTAARKTEEPHIVNLNEDPMLSGVIYYFFKAGAETTVGRKDGSFVPDISLSGLSIMKEHAIVECAGTTVEIRPGQSGAETKINGQPLSGTQVLQHKDRILFGSNNLYVFMNPLRTNSDKDLPKVITYEFAQKEIAQAKGFATSSSGGLTKEQQLIQDQVLEILPMVSEVNAMSEELNKYRSFEVVLISSSAGAAYNAKSGTSVMVKMKNLLNGNTWLWERGKFMNRRYIMQELYQRWQSGDDVATESEDDDPFWEPPEDDVLVGTTNMYLRFLCFPMDFDYRAPVKDYGGHDEGVIDLYIAPCTPSGKPVDPDLIASDKQEPAEAAEDLLDQPFHFKVCVVGALVENARFSKGMKVRYQLWNDAQCTETTTVAGTCQPVFEHERVIGIERVTREWIDYFLNGCIVFELLAKQQESPGDTKYAKMSTKELRNMDHVREVALVRRQSSIMAMNSTETESASKARTNYAVIEKKYERLLQKEKRLQQLCNEWRNRKPAEQQFEPFFRAISSLAFSSGIQFKTKVQLISKLLAGQKAVREEQPDDMTTFLRTKYANAKDEDLVSLVYFGEDEQQVKSKVQKNGGQAPIDLLMMHYGGGGVDRRAKDRATEPDDDQQSRTASQVCTIA